MRTLKQIFFLLVLVFLVGSSASAGTPAFVQECKMGNGGVGVTNYTVTIASSGGTTGCTSNFTSGDALIIAYTVGSGSNFSAVSDPSTGSVSATGATITWHKAGSLNNNIGVGSNFVGIFYACPGDIASPTSSIAITVNMGSARAANTAIFVTEASNVQNSNCLDATAGLTTGNSCCGAASPTTNGNSGTLASATELIIQSGTGFSGTAPTMSAGNYCYSGDGCTGLTVPANGSDTESSPSGSVSWTQYCVSTATTAANSSASIGGTSRPTYDMIMHAGFLPSAASTARHKIIND